MIEGLGPCKEEQSHDHKGAKDADEKSSEESEHKDFLVVWGLSVELLHYCIIEDRTCAQTKYAG